jgi:pimeloyl-ACP methyl ester carboxylesterase
MNTSAATAATKTIVAPDGRTLAYCEVGDSNGPLVVHNHGGPSSRLEALLFAEAAAKHKLRFVCVDRPGIGQSSPQQDRSYAGWADDLTAIADALGHRTFGVTGWSEGGPWALAAAAYIDPARLRHVTNIAGGCYGAFGDNWAADRLSKADALGGFLALHVEPGFRLMYAALGITAEHFRKTYFQQILKAVNSYDRQILLRPGMDAIFCGMSAACFAQGSEGLVQDSELLYRAWAFDVTKIERPVHIWQGLGDTLVAPFINLAIADRMPGAVWHSVDDAGHFIAVGASDEILAIAADELRA